jgi:alpha-D-ribose 1-methylphosphonate 5-phosphate C-P lyase
MRGSIGRRQLSTGTGAAVLHGGSGWSLSWGSSGVAVRKALAGGEHDISVINCGALGLTSALRLQRAGARVTALRLPAKYI